MRTTRDIDSSKWPEIWQAVYRILEQNIVPNQLRAWIQPIELKETQTDDSGTTIHLTAPNDFSASWVRDHYLQTLKSTFSQVIGHNCDVRVSASQETHAPTQHGAIEADLGFQSQNNLSGAITPPMEPPYQTGIVMGAQELGNNLQGNLPSEPPPPLQSPVPTLRKPPQTHTSPNHSRGSARAGSSRISGGAPSEEFNLDPKYNFDSFVVGASNQFAHASAVAVAEKPALQYNPLFIYSIPGLGKTHLLHAIGNHVKAKNMNARVAYLSAEKFVNELIESLQHHRMSQFRTKYRDSYDIILIDDIQFIAGKTKSEEEFFHTFNALHSSKRQIVVTSDRPPKEIKGLEERIRTRFEWGLVSDIHPPEIETRIAILKNKAELDDIYLPDDVCTFLASYVKTNVRELEGVLIRLQAQASLTGSEISLEMAKSELRNVVPDESSHYTVENIQAAVAKHYHLKVSDLKANTRARSIAQPRQIAMYLIRKYTGIGFKEIGQYFGGKDHTTILHAWKKIDRGVENDPTIRDSVESIQNLL